LEDPADIAGSCAGVRELDDLLAGGVRQGASVHIHAAQLVDARVARRRAAEQRRLRHGSRRSGRGRRRRHCRSRRRVTVLVFWNRQKISSNQKENSRHFQGCVRGSIYGALVVGIKWWWWA